jgi:hypothetical protein
MNDSKRPFHVLILNEIVNEAPGTASSFTNSWIVIAKYCDILERAILPETEIPVICQTLREIALSLDSTKGKTTQERLFECAINLEDPR